MRTSHNAKVFASGVLAASLLLVSSCTTTTDNKLSGAFTADSCSLVNANNTITLQARIAGLEKASKVFSDAVAKKPAGKTLTPATQEALDKLNAATSLAREQLNLAVSSPTELLDQRMLLEPLLSVATGLQTDVMNRLEGDLGIDLSAALNTQNDPILDNLLRLQADVETLRGNTGLSADAKAEVNKLLVQIDVLHTALNTSDALGNVNANAEIKSNSVINGETSAALRTVQNSLADVKAKVTADLGEKAGENLLLRLDATVDTAENQVNNSLNVNATVNTVTPRATTNPAPSTSTPTVDVRGAIDSTTNGGSNATILDVNGAVDAAVDVLPSAPETPATEGVNVDAAVDATLDTTADVTGNIDATVNGLLR